MTTNNERERELSISAQREFLKRNPLAKVRLSDVTADSSVWQNRIRDFVDGAEFAETALRAEYETKLAEAQANSSNDAQEALRYRWIRNQKESLYYLIGGAIESMGMVDLADFPQFDELDAAVDAQLKDAGWEVSKDTSAIERVKIRAKVEALEEAMYGILRAPDWYLPLTRMIDELKAKL